MAAAEFSGGGKHHMKGWPTEPLLFAHEGAPDQRIRVIPENRAFRKIIGGPTPPKGAAARVPESRGVRPLSAGHTRRDPIPGR
jgi:hypothetical protein